MFISVPCRFKFKNKKVCIGCFYVKKKKKKKLNISVATPRSIFMFMHSSSHLQFQQSRLVSAGAGWSLGSLMSFHLLYMFHILSPRLINSSYLEHAMFIAITEKKWVNRKE